MRNKNFFSVSRFDVSGKNDVGIFRSFYHHVCYTYQQNVSHIIGMYYFCESFFFFFFLSFFLDFIVYGYSVGDSAVLSCGQENFLLLFLVPNILNGFTFVQRRKTYFCDLFFVFERISIFCISDAKSKLFHVRAFGW